MNRLSRNSRFDDTTMQVEIKGNESDKQNNRVHFLGQDLFLNQNRSSWRPSNRDSKKASFQSSDQQKVVQQYDPFKIPPDIRQCYFHRMATQFGKPVEFNFHQSKLLEDSLLEDQISKSSKKIRKKKKMKILLTKKLCPCCGQQLKQQLPICCRNEEIYKINESLGFYFTYTKVMCLMLFVMACTVGIYALNYVIKDCQQQSQDCFIIYGLPVSRFRVFYTNLLMALNVIIIIIMYLFIAYLYYINAHNQKQIFLNHKKPSDYSIMMTGVDHQKVSGQAILDHFKDFEIVEILYTHKIQSYVQKLQQKSVLTAKKNLFIRKGFHDKIQKIQEQLNEVQSYLQGIRSKLNIEHEKQLRTDKIILKFKTHKMKMDFQKKYFQSSIKGLLNSIRRKNLIQINGNKLQVQPLGQPHEIVWQNLQVTSQQRYFRIFVGNLFTLVVLAISYVLVALLSKVQQDYNDTRDVLLSIAFCIIIQFTNWFLNIFITKLTDYERRKTLTGETRVILLKSFLETFTNTTLIPFSFFIFDWGNDNDEDLITNIFSLFILSNFILPFLSLYINPPMEILRKKKKIIQQGKDCIETQIKANEYFEKIDFDLCGRYAIVIQMLTNSIFYAAVFPIGLILSFIGLVVAYWISKMWLIKYCSIPKYSYRLGKLVNDITATFPCIFAFGYAFNLLQVHQETEFDRFFPVLIALFTIPLTVFFLFYGNKLAEKFVTKQYSALEHLYNQQDKQGGHYNSIRKVADYRQLNPTTFVNQNMGSEINEVESQNIISHLQQYALVKKSSRLKRKDTKNEDQPILSESRKQISKTQKIII